MEITVLGVNDNAPTFNSSYSSSIPEVRRWTLKYLTEFISPFLTATVCCAFSFPFILALHVSFFREDTFVIKRSVQQTTMHKTSVIHI